MVKIIVPTNFRLRFSSTYQCYSFNDICGVCFDNITLDTDPGTLVKHIDNSYGAIYHRDCLLD